MEPFGGEKFEEHQKCGGTDPENLDGAIVVWVELDGNYHQRQRHHHRHPKSPAIEHLEQIPAHLGSERRANKMQLELFSERVPASADNRDRDQQEHQNKTKVP